MSRTCLAPNIKVALVCTGTPCESKNDPEASAEYLRHQYGFIASYDYPTYQCASVAERAEFFYRYLKDDSIDVIWSVRGGEGSADMIPLLTNREQLIKKFKPKLLIGFSDFTPLLVYFQQQFSWPTLHGCGARQLYRSMIDSTSKNLTLDWLLRDDASITLNTLEPLNQLASANLKLNAQIIGGNLSLLQVSLKDAWEVNARDKILLIEEINEQPYKVGRALKHLQRIGFFKQVKAIILAGFNFSKLESLQNNLIKLSMKNVLQQFAHACDCPVLYTDLIGHNEKNYPIPFYTEATLQLGTQAQLTFKKKL